METYTGTYTGTYMGKRLTSIVAHALVRAASRLSRRLPLNRHHIPSMQHAGVRTHDTSPYFRI